MRIAQRTLLTAMIGIVILLVINVYENSVEKLRGQWEVLQIQRFMSKAVRNRKIEKLGYETCTTSLNYYGVGSELKIEEYRKEEDITSNSYYSLISFEEIREELFESGEFFFRPGSVIKVTVCRNTGKGGSRNEYFDLIPEEG